MNDVVDAHLNKYNFDLRKSRNGRFMDQKLTQDNLSFICDCIKNLVGTDPNFQFKTKDIWDSEYFRKNVMFIYDKPDPRTQAANEYDKFIIQPLRLLSYARVLSDKKEGAGYVYSVENFELLDYIALNQINALKFLDKYLTKVLTDSGEISHFNEFENLYRSGQIDNEDFIALRDRYIRFILGNTAINGEVEIRRIFNKVINILAVGRRIPGSRKGHMTDYPIVFKDLEYNTVNWRDANNKKKSLPRKEADELARSEKQAEKITDYEMGKAKNAIKERHSPNSEVHDALSTGNATQVHHMFPDSVFPEYRACLENLILLTASQHNTRAHPNNNTQVVDPEYQRVCLHAKLDSIAESIAKADGFYSLVSFIAMLNDLKGLDIPEDATVNVVRDRLSHY